MLSLILAFSPREGEGRRPNAHPLRWWEYGMVVLVFASAMLIRGTNLDTNPNVLDQDEAIFAREGAIFPGEDFRVTPFEPGNHSHPRMYQVMIGISNELFGYTLTAARLPSAILGALGVMALFLLGRELFGWQVGLIAALFALPWFFHVQLSRLSMNQPGDPLFATLAFYFLVRGLRRKAATDYVLSGIFLGCAQLFYLGGRLAIPVMVAYLIFSFISDRQLVAKQWRYLFIVPMAAFIITMPQNHYLFYFRQPLSTRAEPNILLGGQLQSVIDQGENVGQYLLDQVRNSFLALFQNNDQSGWIGRGSNMMGVVGGPLLMIGVVASLVVLWKRPRWCLPIGWAFSIIFIGSTLSISPPQYQRYFPAVSAFALLAAVGAITLSSGLAHAFKRPKQYLNIGLAIGVLMFAFNFWYYYSVYVPESPALRNRQNWATNATAQELVRASDAGREILLVNQFSTGVENTLVVQYFMMGRRYFIYDDGFADFNSSKAFTIIVAPERTTDLDALKMQYPGGVLREVYLGQDGTLAFYVYERG
jgi:4-amino-4-deoxy-L-arabinose transferase-like glycosyltransferase